MIRRTLLGLSGLSFAALLSSLAAPALAQDAAAPAAAGRSEAWQTYCSVCHGDDGKAQTEKGKEKKARDLTNKKWQAKVDDDRLFKSISNGHDKMPAFKSKLSEDEIKALVAEVRSLAK